jgi:predicted nucleic acid-binding protein
LTGEPPVFVDAAAWVALADSSDRLHPPARDYWNAATAAGQRFLTTDYVLDETYTLLRRRPRGLGMAVAIHDTVDTSALIELVAVDEALRREAWDTFTGYRDKVLSFTDCTSFALMHRRGLQRAFTFDADFQRAGYLVVPP